MEKKKLAVVSLGHLSCDINGGALPACLPYLRAAHGLDYQATAALMFAYSCLSSVTQPLLGWLSDRHAKPWFIPLGILLAGAGIGIMGFFQNYWLIFLCIAVSGIGSAFFHPEAARYANKVSGDRKATGMSFFSIGGNSGFILGPLLVAVCAGAFGIGGLSVFAILGIVMSLVLLWQIWRLPGKAAPAPLPNPPADISPASAEGDELAADAGGKSGVNNWSAFGRLVVVILSRSIVFVGCNTFIPLYWVAMGQSRSQAATALVLFGISGVVCNLIGGWLADRLGYVNVIRTGFCVVAPAVLAFGLIPNIAALWCLLPFLGFALYLPFSSQVVLGQKLLAGNIGFASGVTLGLSTTVGGMAQPILGWIADAFGLAVVFQCLAVVGAAGCLFAFLLSRRLDNA